MTSYIIPLIFLTVLIVSFFKKKDAYSMFVDGSSSAIDLMVGVFPYLITIMMAVEVFRASGVSAFVSNLIAPALSFFGLPKELTELLLLRPLSGAGSLAILDGIFTTYGTDTFIGRCASLIYGSSETVFYITAIYLSQCQVKKLRYAIPVALIATFTGCVVGCLLLRVM
ncbi:MAG: spore maturation protein [Clostridia bacterium]|nr:spore maturation protein [Clostridia bacterium]